MFFLVYGITIDSVWFSVENKNKCVKLQMGNSNSVLKDSLFGKICIKNLPDTLLQFLIYSAFQTVSNILKTFLLPS